MKRLFSIFSLIILFSSASLYSQERIYAPSLFLPEDTEVGVAPNVILDWNAVTGGTLDITYELQLADNADFNDATTFPKTDLTSLMMNELAFGSTYFWRVRAFDGGEESDWSEAWSFTVAVSVELEEPNDAEMVYATQRITWKELTGLTEYQLQIDTSYVWNRVTLETTEDIFGSFINSDSDMWLVGANGLILHYNGAAWTTVDGGTTEDLNDIYFVDENTGFAVGANGTFMTYDGTAWTIVDAGVSDMLNGVAFADADNGFIIGDDGFVMQYSSGTFTTMEATDESGDPITKDFYGIDVVDANNYWACGKSKFIINYDGTSWTGGVVGGKDHYAVWFNAANDGWVSSKDGRIQHYDGSEWTEIQTEADDLFGISFDGTTGYAAGKSGEMVVYDGTVWNKITSGISEKINTVYLKDGFGISAGDNGALLNKAGNGFDSPYAKVFDINADSIGFAVNNLLFGQSFYYRIRGIHSLETSPWSNAKSMTTYPYPNPTLPEEGSSNEQLRIVFEWDEYPGVTRYYISVSDNEEFTSALSFPSDSNSFRLNDFGFGKDYFWRVRAEHVDDISGWSPTRSFTTTNTIELSLPENNAADVDKCPRFEWVEILGTTGYEIWVDTDENFSDPNIFTVEKNMYQCEGTLESGQTYYWKVRGIAGLDISNWSEVWNFKVEAVGVEDLFNEKSLSIYPNPSNGSFTIDLNCTEVANYDVSIYDISGKIIYSTEFKCQQGVNKLNLNLSQELSKGVYTIGISLNDVVVNKRLIVK